MSSFFDANISFIILIIIINNYFDTQKNILGFM